MLYVATRNPAATDSGPGNTSQPFKTIQRAIDSAEVNNANGITTTIKVGPGVYRENLRFEANGHNNPTPIVLQGPSSNTATVSAADVWGNWKKVSGSVSSHHWPYHWGEAPLPSGWESSGATPIVRRRETLFVNGHLPRQVLSMSRAGRRANRPRSSCPSPTRPST